MPHSDFFSSDDLAHLSDKSFFLKKALISKKIKHILEHLQQALESEISRHTLLAPEGFNPKAFQFVKGEHLESFPYQYLDFPRHYTRQDKFGFRSLFWWGHHVVFALIVEGPLVKQYRKNLFTRYSEIADRHLSLSLSSSLWEWKTGAGLTLDIIQQRRSELAAVLDRRTFFKVARVVSFDDPLLETGEIIQEGLRSFRSILPIITP
jgi:hypothetical protein